jgi:hypothetical protein
MFPLSAWVVSSGSRRAMVMPMVRPIDRMMAGVGMGSLGAASSAGCTDRWRRSSRAVSGGGRLEGWLLAWYRRTPPPERATWGGLAACAGMGLVVLMERMVRLRRRRVMPSEFTARFLDRLHEGRLDCGQALDHCELNPSPAARVALAAVRRWGRPASDLERAVTLAHRVETERLRRNVGTLRRVAALAPLLGVLGTLFAVGRAGGDPAGSAAPLAAVLPRARPRPVRRRSPPGDRRGRSLTPLSTEHHRHPGAGRL